MVLTKFNTAELHIVIFLRSVKYTYIVLKKINCHIIFSVTATDSNWWQPYVMV